MHKIRVTLNIDTGMIKNPVFGNFQYFETMTYCGLNKTIGEGLQDLSSTIYEQQLYLDTSSKYRRFQPMNK